MFDIQGFFDNINHERLAQIFASLGFTPELVSWCHSFLKDQMVRLHFNGRTSDPFDFMVGTPQGFPVSPVLSIIYISPLLHKMKDWTNSSLGMYIDNGAIFACGHNWPSIINALREHYTTCVEWLTHSGLSVEPDKTKLIFFRRRGQRSAPPCYIHLPIPAVQMYYQVLAVNMLQYLGFFFDACLSWAYHIDVMCNRARASLKALQLLGNSVQGLDHTSWHLTYNGICLLVLTYGCQLWF